MSGSYLLEILMKSRDKILKINCVLAYFCILITSGVSKCQSVPP